MNKKIKTVLATSLTVLLLATGATVASANQQEETQSPDFTSVKDKDEKTTSNTKAEKETAVEENEPKTSEECETKTVLKGLKDDVLVTDDFGTYCSTIIDKDGSAYSINPIKIKGYDKLVENNTTIKTFNTQYGAAVNLIHQAFDNAYLDNGTLEPDSSAWVEENVELFSVEYVEQLEVENAVVLTGLPTADRTDEPRINSLTMKPQNIKVNEKNNTTTYTFTGKATYPVASKNLADLEEYFYTYHSVDEETTVSDSKDKNEKEDSKTDTKKSEDSTTTKNDKDKNSSKVINQNVKYKYSVTFDNESNEIVKTSNNYELELVK